MRGARTATVIGLAFALSACGGSSGSASSPAGTAHSSPAATPVRGKLSAANHSPKVGVNWPYTVTVTDAAGHALNGTVTIEFTFGSQVVGRDTPPTHPLKQRELETHVIYTCF